MYRQSIRWMASSGVLLFHVLAMCAWSQQPTPEKEKPTGQLTTSRAMVPGMFVADKPEANIELEMDLGVLRVVKDHPFSARIVVQVQRRLSDGNLILQETRRRVYRDSQGRVRTEDRFLETPAADGTDSHSTPISISDLAGGLHSFLIPNIKIAFRLRVSPGFEINVNPAQDMGPAQEGRPGLTVEPLGNQTMEGFQARGSRVTATTPAGAVGNSYPIVVVTERWYSPELKVELYVKRSDPHSGETIFRMVDIIREEPAASLFEIPSDYKIQDEGGIPPSPPKPPDDR